MTVRIAESLIDSEPAPAVRVAATRIEAQTSRVRVAATRILLGGGSTATVRVAATRITTVPTAAPVPDTVLWRAVGGQLRSWDTYTVPDLT